MDRFLHRIRDTRWQTWVLLVFLVLGAWRYFATVDQYGRPGGGVELDGFYYYVYLHSLLRDHDLDLRNDYELQGYAVKYQDTPRGRPGNPFSIGPALLWAPFLLLANLLAWLRVLLGERGLSVNVMSDFHQNLTLFGTYLYGCAAVYCCFRLLLRLTGRTLALVCALGCALGTPLLYYMIACPSYSHAQSAFAFSALAWAWLAFREAMTLRRWLVLGLLAGLTALVHPGNVLLVTLCAGTALGPLVRAAKERRGHEALLALRGPALAALAAVLVFSPQMLAWKALYGRFLLTPQGPDFMRFSESLWHATLFAPRNGLLPHAPVAALSLLGLVLMLRKAPALAAPCLLALALLALVNGAVWDWWGWGFGARRYTVALPLFTLGLASFSQDALGLLERHRQRLAPGILLALILAAVMVNIQFFREFRKETLTGSDLVPTRESYSIAFRGLLRDLSETVGNPLSFPANWAFALRHGVDPDRYDKLYGFYFLDENHVGANPHPPKLTDRLDLARSWPERFLTRGWGTIRKLEDAVKARPVTGDRAGFLLPLNVDREITLTLRVRPALQGATLSVLFNGQPLLRKRLSGGWQDVEVKVPRGQVQRGVNQVVLEHRPPEGPLPTWSRAVGSTGRTSPVDIAAVGASTDAGDFADIWVDGRLRSANRRGINVTTVDPRSGKVLGVEGFDTHLNRQASQALYRYIESLAPGTLVALATRDEPSRNFDARARDALALVGVRADLRGKYRHAFAAVGVRGGRPGSALERLAETGRAHVAVGRPPPPWRVSAWYQYCDLSMPDQEAGKTR